MGAQSSNQHTKVLSLIAPCGSCRASRLSTPRYSKWYHNVTHQLWQLWVLSPANMTWKSCRCLPLGSCCTAQLSFSPTQLHHRTPSPKK